MMLSMLFDYHVGDLSNTPTPIFEEFWPSKHGESIVGIEWSRLKRNSSVAADDLGLFRSSAK